MPIPTTTWLSSSTAMSRDVDRTRALLAFSRSFKKVCRRNAQPRRRRRRRVRECHGSCPELRGLADQRDDKAPVLQRSYSTGGSDHHRAGRRAAHHDNHIKPIIVNNHKHQNGHIPNGRPKVSLLNVYNRDRGGQKKVGKKISTKGWDRRGGELVYDSKYKKIV